MVLPLVGLAALGAVSLVGAAVYAFSGDSDGEAERRRQEREAEELALKERQERRRQALDEARREFDAFARNHGLLLSVERRDALLERWARRDWTEDEPIPTASNAPLPEAASLADILAGAFAKRQEAEAPQPPFDLGPEYEASAAVRRSAQEIEERRRILDRRSRTLQALDALL